MVRTSWRYTLNMRVNRNVSVIWVLADNGRERITTNLGQHGCRTKIQLLGPMGKKKTLKMNKRASHFVKKWRLLMFSDISRKYFVWGHFWKYKPPGGLPETNPGFLETQISAKSRVWKRFGRFRLMIFCYLSGTNNSVALTFQGGSYEYGNEIYCIWEVGRSLTFLWTPPPYWENNKQINISEVL